MKYPSKGRQLFIIKLVMRDNTIQFLGQGRILTPNKHQAFQFFQVPYWRKIYKKFHPKAIIIREVKLQGDNHANRTNNTSS